MPVPTHHNGYPSRPSLEPQSPVPEIGDLIHDKDYSLLVEWAKRQDIPPYDDLDGMVGSIPVTINDEYGTAGWIKASGGYNTTPPIQIDHPGGQEIRVIEGGGSVLVDHGKGEGHQQYTVEAGTQSALMRFEPGERPMFRNPHGPDSDTLWYVSRFLGEPPAPAPEQS